jgi:hypothetical protein
MPSQWPVRLLNSSFGDYEDVGCFRRIKLVYDQQVKAFVLSR